MQKFKRKPPFREKMTEKKEEDKVKKQYSELAAKQGLPSYEDLDKEFNLEAIDVETHILRNVAKQIANKHEHYAGVVENIVHPDQTMTSMHESQAFSDGERTLFLDLLRRLMKVYRTYTLCDLEKDGFEAFIKNSWADWSALKLELRAVLSRLAGAWEETNDLKVEVEYLG